MKRCKYEDLFDNYLLNRLDEEKNKEIEEHYFNCPSCFEKIAERNELISIIKLRGNEIFRDEGKEDDVKGLTWFERIVSLLTPKQWAATAVSACLLLIIFGLVFIFIPYSRITPYSFRSIGYDKTRGGEIIIKLVPPVDIKSIPSKFEWSRLVEDGDYKIYIFDNGNQLWSSTTKENFIVLPEEVRSRMIVDKKYSCEVKAFSSKGTLEASGKIEFKIQRAE